MTVVLQEDRCPGCGKFVRRGAACPRCLVFRAYRTETGWQTIFAFPGGTPVRIPRSVLTHT